MNVVVSGRPTSPANGTLKRGATFLEVLVAVLIVGAAAAGAMATWRMTSSVPLTKRLTEISSFVGMQEIERIKAGKYSSLTNTPNGTPIIDWYDKNGKWLQRNGSVPANAFYQAMAWTRAGSGHGVERDGVVNVEDLVEIYVEVWSSDGVSKKYDTEQTLVTFGGL